MTDDLKDQLADVLRSRATAVEFTPAPVDVIERGGRKAARTAWVSTAAVVTTVATIAIGGAGAVVWSGQDRENTPAATATDGGVFGWGVRGSLSDDRAALASIREQIIARSRIGAENPGSARVAVLYADDGPAGRIAVGTIGLADGGNTITRSEVVVLAGPRGAHPSTLQSLGNEGEPAEDGVVSRLVTGSDGKRWLFVLGSEKVDAMQVSWYPVYGQDGVRPRVWQPVATRSGVSLTEASGTPVAARVKLFSAGTQTADRPVFEDSDTLNDPSFFPVAGIDVQKLPAGTDLRGANEQTVRWLASQAGVATGVPVADMKVTVLWASGSAAVTTLQLPGGGTLAVYGQAGERQHIEVVPVTPAEAGRQIFVRPTAEGVLVIAPHAPGATVRVNGEELQLDATGVGEIAIKVDAGTPVKVDAGPAGVADLGAENRADPFDLR